MHSSSFLLHTGGSGGGGGAARATYQPASSFSGSGGAPAFTTLPPIFSARPAQSGSHTARAAASGPLSSRSQQQHRGASTQRLRTSTHLKAALPQFHKARDAGDPGGSGGGGSSGRLASSRGMLIASGNGNGSRMVAGRKVASNADMRGGQGSGAAGAGSRGPQRHDEATVRITARHSTQHRSAATADCAPELASQYLCASVPCSRGRCADRAVCLIDRSVRTEP